MQQNQGKKTTNSRPIPHIPLPFKEVIADVLKVKPPQKGKTNHDNKESKQKAEGIVPENKKGQREGSHMAHR
jgi:hypothetical protein